MKRSDALAQLSRDHHHGLVVAQQLNRATDATAAAARDAFLRFWEQEGHQHFRAEEEVLLPALARHCPPTHDAVVRTVTDHIDLRRRAADVAADPTLEELRTLGDRLHAHIRHEERVLFPLIEAALSDDELADLAVALEQAHKRRTRSSLLALRSAIRAQIFSWHRAIISARPPGSSPPRTQDLTNPKEARQAAQRRQRRRVRAGRGAERVR